MEKEKFKFAFAEMMETLSFIRNGKSWFLDGENCIVVINLQKSDFDEKYYINFGVSLKSLSDLKFPPENKCHIQSRLTSLFPEYAIVIDLACAATSSPTEFEKFALFFRNSAAPFCRDCLSSHSLRVKIEAGEFKKALITKAAKEALKLL